MSVQDSAKPEGTADGQSAGSDKGNGQPSSEQVIITKEAFDSLNQTVQTLARQLQSDKDRAVKGVSQRIDGVEKDLKTILQLAEKEGKSVTDLIKAVEYDEEREFRETIKQMAQSFKNGGLPQQSSGGTGQSQGVDVNQVLKDLELDVTDVRVREYVGRSGTFATREQALLEAAKLVKSLSRKPTDADEPSNVSERAQAGSKQDALMSEYKEGSKNLTGNALINYKMQMRKKGLQIS